MIVSREPLKDKEQTAKKIYQIVNEFYLDLHSVMVPVKKRGQTLRASDLSLQEFFDIVRNIPYRRDPRPVEVVARPYYLFKHQKLGIDCKKKAILIASYLKANGIPFRFIGSSNRPDRRIHHIFPQALIDGEYKNVDATYSQYRLFQPKNVTAWEELK